jgi:hypothetical protein
VGELIAEFITNCMTKKVGMVISYRAKIYMGLRVSVWSQCGVVLGIPMVVRHI